MTALLSCIVWLITYVVVIRGVSLSVTRLTVVSVTGFWMIVTFRTAIPTNSVDSELVQWLILYVFD